MVVKPSFKRLILVFKMLSEVVTNKVSFTVPENTPARLPVPLAVA